MEFLIITGLSGAGKSRAADVLEDLDYYCVDNMPIALMPRFAELCIATAGRYEKVALVTDVREKDGFGQLLERKLTGKLLQDLCGTLLAHRRRDVIQQPVSRVIDHRYAAAVDVQHDVKTVEAVFMNHGRAPFVSFYL